MRLCRISRQISRQTRCYWPTRIWSIVSDRCIAVWSLYGMLVNIVPQRLSSLHFGAALLYWTHSFFMTDTIGISRQLSMYLCLILCTFAIYFSILTNDAQHINIWVGHATGIWSCIHRCKRWYFAEHDKASIHPAPSEASAASRRDSRVERPGRQPMQSRSLARHHSSAAVCRWYEAWDELKRL